MAEHNRGGSAKPKTRIKVTDGREIRNRERDRKILSLPEHHKRVQVASGYEAQTEFGE